MTSLRVSSIMLNAHFFLSKVLSIIKESHARHTAYEHFGRQFHSRSLAHSVLASRTGTLASGAVCVGSNPTGGARHNQAKCRLTCTNDKTAG
jgi:hypothetical protein